jgi:hypothetical protein
MGREDSREFVMLAGGLGYRGVWVIGRGGEALCYSNRTPLVEGTKANLSACVQKFEVCD